MGSQRAQGDPHKRHRALTILPETSFPEPFLADQKGGFRVNWFQRNFLGPGGILFGKEEFLGPTLGPCWTKKAWEKRHFRLPDHPGSGPLTKRGLLVGPLAWGLAGKFPFQGTIGSKLNQPGRKRRNLSQGLLGSFG